jgi:dethiobiotin synthase
VRYWKPIQTGIEQDDDTATVVTLACLGGDRVLNAGVRLRHPVSPHLAARLSNTRIEIDELLRSIDTVPDRPRFVVEGAGGVLVPIDDMVLMVDLMRRMTLPVVIVARSTLGTINHTLLSIEALRARGLEIAGVVLNGPPNAENRAAIQDYGRVAVLGELPRLEPLDAASLGPAAGFLDPDNRLAELMS